MKKWEKNLVSAAGALALVLCAVPEASAMHIMEGYLPPGVLCGVGGAVPALPGMGAGVHPPSGPGNSARRCFCWAMAGRLCIRHLLAEDPLCQR